MIAVKNQHDSSVYEFEYSTEEKKILEFRTKTNQELADSYEAIANLFEKNLELEARLQALEGGVSV